MVDRMFLRDPYDTRDPERQCAADYVTHTAPDFFARMLRAWGDLEPLWTTKMLAEEMRDAGVEMECEATVRDLIAEYTAANGGTTHA